MSLCSTIAGPYSAAWEPGNAGNAYSLGETSDGFKLRWKFLKHPIKGAAYAQTVIDSVYLGAEVHVSFTCIQASLAAFDTSNSSAAWPYGDDTGKLGVIGKLDLGSSIAGSLVLTAVLGTTAENSPATLTARRAILREDFEVLTQLASRLRTVPIEMRLYPYNSGTAGSPDFAFFTYT